MGAARGPEGLQALNASWQPPATAGRRLPAAGCTCAVSGRRGGRSYSRCVVASRRGLWHYCQCCCAAASAGCEVTHDTSEAPTSMALGRVHRLHSIGRTHPVYLCVRSASSSEQRYYIRVPCVPSNWGSLHSLRMGFLEFPQNGVPRMPSEWGSLYSLCCQLEWHGCKT